MPITAAQVEGRSVTPPQVEEPPVTVKVTKRGHGKISTGNHSQTYGDELYADGETFKVAANIARDLEDRNFVIILEEPTVSEVVPTIEVEVPTEKPAKAVK